MVGVTPTTGRLKSVGPSLPSPLVAVTWIVVVATASGVPVRKPVLDSDAHEGRPVPLHVMGAVPFAANWKL